MYSQSDDFLRQKQIYDSQTLKGYIHVGVEMRSSFDKRAMRSLGTMIRAEEPEDTGMVLLKR